MVKAPRIENRNAGPISVGSVRQQSAPVSSRPEPTAGPLRITVLSGGPSAERDVSLESGRAVADALASLGHRVTRSDINPDDLSALDADTDVIFIALHGTFGEDGQLQRILEQRDIPFCGSGADASARAMDKIATKRCFAAAGIPTPRFDKLTAETLDAVLARWTAPAVLKPVAQGSSVGCHLVRDAAMLRDRAESVVRDYGAAMIEDLIDGPELTVGILGGDALPPIEIRTQRDFYTYAAKYEDNQTQYLFDIDLPPALLERAQQLGLEAFRALGGRDFGRVDWMVDSARQELFALEVNTIPGFTSHSLLPKAAARAGVGFAELCNRIVTFALQRRASATAASET